MRSLPEIERDLRRAQMALEAGFEDHERRPGLIDAWNQLAEELESTQNFINRARRAAR